MPFEVRIPSLTLETILYLFDTYYCKKADGGLEYEISIELI